MESCHYTKVDSKVGDEKKSWKPFLRQLLVCSGLFTTYFVTGLSFGAPTVVIPQMRRSNITISDGTASWLSSALSYSTLPWVIILPIISERFGRKIAFYFAVATSIISFIIFYFGHSTLHFLYSQIIQGILLASNLTISVILVTEYTSPEYRGVFLCIKSASLWWGVWVSNAMGSFFEWNYIGLVGLICSAFYVTVFIWPESPHWLATKGRFEECIQAHRWLKGNNETSENELRKLVETQKEYLRNIRKNDTIGEKMKTFVSMLKEKEFYMPIAVSFVVLGQYHASGKIVCSIYSLEVIKKMTASESTAYAGMLILDGVNVAGMYLGCVLSKYLTRRFLLLVPTGFGILFLFSMSLYVWLIEQSYVIENKIVSILLLGLFSVCISCGPMIVSCSIYAEMIPLKFKSYAVIVIILFHFSLTGTVIKTAPLVFSSCGLFGTFLLYGIMATVFTFALYKYLPETKDKTLQEIEEYFKD